MEKQSCPPGFRQDTLVNECIFLNKPQHPDTEECCLWLNPIVWVCVGVVMCAALLGLLLWFIIYRRHSHNTGKRSSGFPACSERSPDQGTSTLQPKADLPASCPHTNGKIQETSVCDMDWGCDVCTRRVEHGIPVPATELGDSALVTTKTVQSVEP